MDLLLFLLAFLLGFGLFMSAAFFLAKWMFPKIEDNEEVNYDHSKIHNRYLPKITKGNPYSFKRHSPYSS